MKKKIYNLKKGTIEYFFSTIVKGIRLNSLSTVSYKYLPDIGGPNNTPKPWKHTSKPKELIRCSTPKMSTTNVAFCASPDPKRNP